MKFNLGDLQIVAHTSMDSSIAEDSSIDIEISPNCIPLVDIRRFSQSELLSFSAASSSYDFSRSEEDLVLKIDRSSFKESAGSRRQTYSRLRLAPRKTEFQLNSVPCPSLDSHRFPSHTPQAVDENSKIVKCLRDLFAVEDREGELFSIDIQYDEFLSNAENINDSVQEVSVDVIEIGRKRKRMPESDTANEYKVNEVIVNSEKKPRESAGTKIYNIVALANIESPYDCELRKITSGLKTEAELLYLGVQWIIPRKSLIHYKEIHDQPWLTSNRYIRPNGHLLLHLNKISSFLSSIWGFQDADQSRSRNRGYTLSVYSILPENASELACHEKNEAVKSCLNIQNGNHFPLKVTSAGISVDRICSVMFFSKDDFLNNLQVIYNNSPKVGKVCVRNYYHYHLRNYVEDILKLIEWESERAVKKRNNLYFIELSYVDSETPICAGVYENKYHIGTYSEPLERSIHQNTRVFELVQQSSEGFSSIEEIRELLLYFLEKLL